MNEWIMDFCIIKIDSLLGEKYLKLHILNVIEKYAANIHTLNKSVCISLFVNAFEKDINPFVLPSIMVK